MVSFIDAVVESAPLQRLEAGLAQIEVNIARKREEKMEEKEQREKNDEKDSRAAEYSHGPDVEEDAPESETLDMGAKSKDMKETKRLKHRKKAAKAKSRESRDSKQKKKSKKAKKTKTRKERKEHREVSSKLQHNIDDHPKDISILDSDATGQLTKEQINYMQQLSKPVKVTRIVPMKVGPSWVFPTIDNPEPKPVGQEENLPSRQERFTPTKKRPVSSSESNSGDNEFHRKRARRGIDDSEINTPTPASRFTHFGEGSGSQPCRSPDAAEQEMRGGEDGLRSPTPSTTSTSSSSSSSGLYLETLKASSGAHGEQDSTLVNAGEDTYSEGIEYVPDTWQYVPGKIRGRLETTEDTEMEENVAFSSYYLSTHLNGVTISGINFKVISLPTSSKVEFDETEEGAIRIVLVAQGTVEVTLCSKVFSVQEGGMWRLRPYEECTVNNHGDEDAFVHVSSIKRM